MTQTMPSYRIICLHIYVNIWLLYLYLLLWLCKLFSIILGCGFDLLLRPILSSLWFFSPSAFSFLWWYPFHCLPRECPCQHSLTCSYHISCHFWMISINLSVTFIILFFIIHHSFTTIFVFHITTFSPIINSVCFCCSTRRS